MTSFNSLSLNFFHCAQISFSYSGSFTPPSLISREEHCHLEPIATRGLLLDGILQSFMLSVTLPMTDNMSVP